MSENTLFFTNKSGIVFTPEAFDLLGSYTRHFVHDAQSKLDAYLQELETYRQHIPECNPQEDEHARAVRREITRAQIVIEEIEQLKERVRCLYDWHFEVLAEVFKDTRIQLGRAKIEDDPSLHAAVKHVMAMLRAENPKFSESKFINFINVDV